MARVTQLFLTGIMMMSDLDTLLSEEPETSQVLLAYGEGPRRELALAALKHAMTGREIQRASANIDVVIVEVPTAQWLSEVSVAATRIWANSKVEVRSTTKKNNQDDEALLKRHACGCGVVIVTQAPHLYVGSPFLAVAKRHVKVAMPPKTAVLRVARSFLRGRVTSAFRDVPICLLDFDTLCACLTPGDHAKSSALKVTMALSRQQGAANSQSLPDLTASHGYGDARIWAADLATDIVDYRQRRIGWSDVSNGAIFFGPPGTGKSLLARIAAKAAGLPIVLTSIADHFAKSSGYLDGVIKEQRAAFERAASLAPCLLFVDELDALPKRGEGGRNKDFWLPVITDFLTLLDSSMYDREGIVVVGATNRIEEIDPAILREGRLGRKLYIGPPNAEELAGILRFYLGDDLRDVDLLPLVRSSEGATGADAVGWAKGARRLARSQRRPMRLEDLASQILTVDDRPDDILFRVAVHEAGHVLVGLAKGLLLKSVTIISGQGNSGMTYFSERNRRILTKQELEDIVVMMLAGRAAEIVLLGASVSTASGGGSESDLAQATQRVTAWHTTLGMGMHLTWNLGNLGAFDREMRQAVEEDLQRLHLDALALVREHADQIGAVARGLVDRKTLSVEEIKSMLDTTGGLNLARG